jgi:hypothetical protein
MSQRSFNREYFVNEIMQSLVTKLFPGWEFLTPPGLWCILTTARSIFKMLIKIFWRKFPLPYSVITLFTGSSIIKLLDFRPYKRCTAGI